MPKEPQLPPCAGAGTVVQLLLEPTTARQGFTLPNPKKLGSIKALYSEVDFTKSGSADIVIGREDGQLEVRHVKLLCSEDIPAQNLWCSPGTNSFQNAQAKKPGCVMWLVVRCTTRIMVRMGVRRNRKHRVGSDSKF